MKRSSKYQQVVPINLVLNGGLNYANTPTNLEDNEVRIANNYIYDPSTEYIITRPGTACQTKLVCDGTNGITSIYYYEKSASVAYLVASCNGNLYYLSGTSLDEWTLIGALNDISTVPQYLTFNTKLLIADGGDAIRTWDGTTYSTIATSPKANTLSVIKNRVVANHVGELDSVYLSAPNDETTWNTSTTAVGLKAGYGDNLTVTGFGVFGDDLLVFKKGKSLKRIYRVNVASATTSEWYVSQIAENSSAQNTSSIVNAWNNVFFVDVNGFKSIKGVQQYGDLETDSIGSKVNNLFTNQTTCYFMNYIPAYNAIWWGMGDRVFCYTERSVNTQNGVTTIPAFTDLLFKQGRINAVCQANTTVYIAGNDGYLYKMDENISTDATSSSTSASYTSNLNTKTFAFTGDGILKKLQWCFRPISSGSMSMNIGVSEETTIAAKAITLRGGGTYLYDSTGYLAAATGYLYNEGASPWIEIVRGRIRSNQLFFELLTTSGRVGIEWVKAEIALVEG